MGSILILNDGPRSSLHRDLPSMTAAVCRCSGVIGAGWRESFAVPFCLLSDHVKKVCTNRDKSKLGFAVARRVCVCVCVCVCVGADM